MVLLSRLFPASRTAQNASRLPGRRRPKASPRATPTAARVPSLAAEPLERRAMLAVTASIVGGDLVIAYNAAGDSLADISSDGTIYTVSGTGLAATKFNVADVTGVISVADKAAVFGQQFKVNAGTPLANALQVNANVESTSLLGGITTARPGDVSIGSAVISLASDISTAATSANIAFTGSVTLTNGVSVSTGAAAGNILFSSTIDGARTLDLTAGTGNVTFTGAVGGGTPLAGISLTSAASVTSASTLSLDGTPALATDGITIAAGVNKVSLTKDGSTIQNFSANGIWFKGGSTDSTIGGFTIEQNGGDGVRLDAGGYSGTTISANSISGNDGNGVRLTAATGPVSIADNLQIDLNSLNGVYAENSTTVSIAGNSIGGNKNHGVSVFGGSGVIDGNGIVNNVFNGVLLAGGYDVTGNLIENNGLNGIQVATGLTNLDITGNTITANDLDGILFDTGGVTGFDVSDNAIYLNTKNGILVGTGTYTGTVIGGGNEITLNTQNGIELAAGGVVGLTITGNTIGTLADGTTDAGNVLDGIQVNAGGYAGTSITANTIAYNDADGIHLAADGSAITGLSITGNAIFSNDSDGIQADAGDYAGTVIQGNEISANDQEGIFLNPNGVVLASLVIGGGDAATLGNDISGSGAAAGGNGILAGAGDLTGTTIAGNTIRDNGNSTTHEGSGILVEGSNLTIGWTAEAGAPNTVGNTITGNAANGIEIRGAQAQNNTILSNSIYLNGYTFSGMVVGDGIALVDGGNGALPSPRILGAVADAATDTIRVQVVVPAAGSYYVQLFANTAFDERGLVPVDVNGFEGRSYVGDSPAQSGSPVTAGKPAIAGTPIAGNTVALIEMPADRVPAGSWITATATAVESGVAGATSGFSAAVQLPNAPVLAVGSDGPAVWVPHYDYQALSGNVLRLGGLTVTEVNRLVAMRGRQIFISANGRSEVATATVANVRRIGRTAVNMVLRNITSPEGSLAGTAGRLEPGPLTLPTARLYDAATGEVVLDVGAEAIAASLQAAGVAPVAADAFVSRFQGGLRVASGDVDGDGFAELVTAPGASPARPAATFGTATRIITIYSGNPAAAWESASLDVTAAFPGYSGGFQVTLGDVLPDAAGEGSGVVELIVAGTNKVAVYELTIPEPGAAPEIAATPAAEWAIGPRFRITGLAAGDFSAAASDELVVATAAPAGTVVRTFSVADGSFAVQSTFRARSYVEGTPQRRLRDVFARGASLAVGDIDGAADGKPELVLAAAAQGLANFRVLANDLVTGGTQQAIDTALAVGNGFTQQSRSQYAVVNGRRVWQPGRCLRPWARRTRPPT